MGTFHDTTDPLHGMTVVATVGDRVYVGRCHERTPESVVLIDADEHVEGQDGRSNAEYLSRAARFGVWSRHDRLVLPADGVEALAPLADYFQGAETAAAAVSAPAPEAARPASPTVPAAGAEADGPFALTEAARREVRRLLAAEDQDDLGLRLGVAGGGCSGLVYEIEFSARREDDLVVAEDGFEVLMDRKSAVYLRGVTLDHEQGLAGKGFRFSNPNASNTCGCGESFAV